MKTGIVVAITNGRKGKQTGEVLAVAPFSEARQIWRKAGDKNKAEKVEIVLFNGRQGRVYKPMLGQKSPASVKRLEEAKAKLTETEDARAERELAEASVEDAKQQEN